MAVANIPDQAQYGGYNFSFTKPVPERFSCNICIKVLRDPHLIVCCGQHFCESCLKHWFKKQKTTCPHCREENCNHVLNKALKREIDDLEIRCTKQVLGCQWVGELSSLQTHLDSDKGCGYVEVQCSNKCGAKMKRKELKAHLERQCPLRKIHCQYCHYEDTYRTITGKHYDKCPHYPLPCPNKCGTTGIRRVDMDSHRSRCELEPVKCPFREAGCKVNVVRKDFDSHMSRNQQKHLLVLLGAYQETKRELVESRRELNECRKELSLKLLEALEKSKPKLAKLKLHGDKKVTLCMNDYSLYKYTGKVWYSPPFYYGDGYKFCVAVYANGKGAGAGTHVSVELHHLNGDHDDETRWAEIPQIVRDRSYGISIQMMPQSKKAQTPDHPKRFLTVSHPLKSMPSYRYAIGDNTFIDHQRAEQVMVLNDTIELRVSLDRNY